MQAQAKEKHSEIETVIYEMLTENTGSHMLDSGGAYGRNHEKNRKLSIDDFKKQPEATLEISFWKPKDGEPRVELNPSINVFHRLTSLLYIDDLSREFNAMPVENWDCEEFYGVSSEGESWLKEKGFDKADYTGGTFNTYNWCSGLSQTLQGCFLRHEESGDTYLLVQIHGGCDVRGGYTDAKLFYVDTGYQEHYAVIDDRASFCVEIPESEKHNNRDLFTDTMPEDYMTLDWYGDSEFIDYEGSSASDEYLNLFAKYAGATLDGDDVIIEGEGGNNF